MYNPEHTGGGGGRKETRVERAVRLGEALLSGVKGVMEDHKNAWRNLSSEEKKRAQNLLRRKRRKR